jgi:hypothetical protein
VSSRAGCSEIGRRPLRESVMASNDFLTPPKSSSIASRSMARASV